MRSELPVMLLKSFIILPNQEVKLELNNEVSKSVVSIAYQSTDQKILVVCPVDQKEENPDVSDLPEVGVISKIISKITLPNGNLRVTLKGLERVSVLEYKNNENQAEVLDSVVTSVVIPKFDEAEEEAIKRKLFELLNAYIESAPHVSNSILERLKKCPSLFSMTDMITSFLPLSIDKKLIYMQEINAMYRAKNLIKDINFEIQVIKLDEKLDESISKELEQTQKEYLLKEKLKEIKKELNEESLKEEDINEFTEKLNLLDIDEKIKAKINREITKYSLTSEASPEVSIIRNYIETMLSLPWNIYSKDETSLKKIREKLDKTHYALDCVKERILEYIAVKMRNPEIKSPIICLVGPPGVGKTTLAISIADSLKREFAKISVGGLNDVSELIGHRKTYVGANPGKIINSLIKCKTANPVILLDEVDKMVKDVKGDPASALLDILDANQNIMFEDNYIDEPFNLSKVFFILTANNEELIPDALRDRLEIIHLSGYTEFQKIDIANNYLLPKLYESHKITNEIKINNEMLRIIINNYTKEAGVRDLDRALNKIIRKIITESFLNLEEIKINLKKDDIKKYLGQKLFEVTPQKKTVSAGVVNGLAYTNSGGSVMPIEASMYDGNGKFTYTGMLGDSLKESIEVALSYIKTNSDKFEINDNYFTKKDIHIHFLEGGIKKDGPSAGVGIITSLISLFTKTKVSKDIAMTGEISLKGDVLKVGGLKEKLIGAYNGNIKKVIIPESNIADVEELDKRIKDKLEIITVNSYQEIYNLLFKNDKE